MEGHECVAALVLSCESKTGNALGLRGPTSARALLALKEQARATGTGVVFPLESLAALPPSPPAEYPLCGDFGSTVGQALPRRVPFRTGPDHQDRRAGYNNLAPTAVPVESESEQLAADFGIGDAGNIIAVLPGDFSCHAVDIAEVLACLQVHDEWCSASAMNQEVDALVGGFLLFRGERIQPGEWVEDFGQHVRSSSTRAVVRCRPSILLRR